MARFRGDSGRPARQCVLRILREERLNENNEYRWRKGRGEDCPSWIVPPPPRSPFLWRGGAASARDDPRGGFPFPLFPPPCRGERRRSRNSRIQDRKKVSRNNVVRAERRDTFLARVLREKKDHWPLVAVLTHRVTDF